MTELEVFQRSLDISRLTLIVSLLVSTISIVFACLEMAFQRSHNIRSMRPLCDLDIQERKGVVELRLRNAGLGPLVVSSASLLGVDGKELLAAEGCAGLIVPPLDRRVLLYLGPEEWAGFSACEFLLRYSDIYDRRREARVALASIRPAEREEG